MLIIPVKEGEAIERALKRFKRKFDKTGTMKQLRSRQQFNKPSVVKRQQKVKAVYVQLRLLIGFNLTSTVGGYRPTSIYFNSPTPMDSKKKQVQ